AGRIEGRLHGDRDHRPEGRLRRLPLAHVRTPGGPLGTSPFLPRKGGAERGRGPRPAKRALCDRGPLLPAKLLYALFVGAAATERPCPPLSWCPGFSLGPWMHELRSHS